MDILGAIKSIFIDEYKMGVERQSKKPVVYVDVDQIDPYQQSEPLFERLMQTVKDIQSKVSLTDGPFDLRNEKHLDQVPEDLRERLVKDLSEVADIVRPQLEEFHPGLTADVSNVKLAQLLAAAFNEGPFSDRGLLKDHGICVINEPKGHEIDPEHLIKDGVFGFTKGINRFNTEHLRPLPGDKELWDQLIGEHEGEHCNQTENDKKTPEERDVKTLNGETDSDLAALKSMREEGHPEVAQAWIDIRIIATAEGDTTHATSIFLEEGAEFKEATLANLNAAKDLTTEMNRAVQTISGLDDGQAETLRKKDPQRYADYLEEQIKTGDFPVEHRMSDSKIKAKLEDEMGIKPGGIWEYPNEKFPQLLETYKKLEQNGGFQTRADNPELLKKMSEQYIGATRRLFIENTTPEKPIVPKPAAAASPESEERPLTERLQENARTEIYNSMDRNVARKLGISEEQASNLYDTNQERYMKLVEGMIKDGTYDTKSTVPLSKQEIDSKVAKLYGVDQKNLPKIPYALKDKAESYLEEKGETSFTTNNPYLIDAAKKQIEEQKEASAPEAAEPQASTCAKSPFAENAAECTGQKTEATPAPEKVASLYIQPQSRAMLSATV